MKNLFQLYGMNLNYGSGRKQDSYDDDDDDYDYDDDDYEDDDEP